MDLNQNINRSVKPAAVQDQYYYIYQSTGFERKGLFELIKKQFNPETVLYPGCLVHITPSFYFKHIVYVDKCRQSIDFFNHPANVSSLIDQYKTYREIAYWKFINKDFTQELDLRENSFDLLLSLFSGRLIEFCEHYIKPNGLILTTSLFSDHDSVVKHQDYELLHQIRCVNGKYRIENNITTKGTSKLKPTNTGFKYIDNEIYYIYKKKKHF